MTPLGIFLIGSACFAFGALIVGAFVVALCKSAAKGDEMIERKGH